jgi:hypothetical protein
VKPLRFASKVRPYCSGRSLNASARFGSFSFTPNCLASAISCTNAAGSPTTFRKVLVPRVPAVTALTLISRTRPSTALCAPANPSVAYQLDLSAYSDRSGASFKTKRRSPGGRPSSISV